MNKQKTIHGLTEPTELPRGRSAKNCAACGAWFSLPTCHASRHRCCSSECSEQLQKQSVLARKRECRACGSAFIPRRIQITNGQGLFCSLACSVPHAVIASLSPDVRAKRAATWRSRYESGQIKAPAGHQHPRWLGGKAAAKRRRISSGRSAAELRRYRKKNPEKVREWAHRRARLKVGRLPRGTVAAIREKQRNRCAACACSLLNGFHVDHVIPLHLGGRHEPLNIQLLCPSCNVRKWALHPVEFAQRNGKLL